MIEQMPNQVESGGLSPTSPLQFTVRQIPSFQTHEWLLKKHYAKRIPQIMYAFGLYDSELVNVGVCTFGFACRKIQDKYAPVAIFELNRLVLNDNQKNAASYFVSKCLRLYPVKPCYIVSYADANHGHHGYIYQALNGIYTGESSSENIVTVNGKQMHRRSLNAMFGTSSVTKLAESMQVDVEEQVGKHRYFFLLGNKKDKAILSENLQYTVHPYPKGENKRYNADYQPSVQGILV